jgi:hypothetical protein
MLSEDTGINLLVHKEPVVATHVGQFDLDAAISTYKRYKDEHRTFVATKEILQYQNSLIQTVLDNQTAIGCLVAPFGYGKTSTAINIWQACEDANLLGIPPFSCSSVAEMGLAIASALIYRLEENSMDSEASSIRLAYDEYLVSSAQRLAEQDVEKYGIEYDVALMSIQEKIESGHLQLEASGTNLLQFMEKVVRVVLKAGYSGVVIIVDEFQQFLGNINKAIVTNFRTLIWGLRTRGSLPLGFVLTMDPDTEQNLIDRGADILHRIRNDGLYLAFSHVYDREFPRELWSRYAESLDFLENSHQIVDLPTLEAIGQICERPDLSNGPRTVINAFQRIADSYLQRNHSYSPLDLIDDFVAGQIKFDGDRGKIASLFNEISSYDYIKRVPENVDTLKLLAAFPRGCPREVAERYGLHDPFDRFLSELRGEVVLELPEGVALIDLQEVGKPQDKLRIILKKYWMQITETEIIADRAKLLFAQYGVEPLFPEFTSINDGWRSLTGGFQETEHDGYFQLYEGTFFSEYPYRRVAVQVCSTLSQTVIADEFDVQFVFLLRSKKMEEDEIPRHLDNARTLILQVDIEAPFDRKLPRHIRDIEDYLSPVTLTPGVLVSLLSYIDQQLPQIEGMSDKQKLEITDKIRKLREFLLTMVFGNTVFADQNIQVFSRGAQAVRDALFRLLKQTYPHYQTLMTSSSWRNTLDTYEQVLSQMDVAQRRGLEPFHEKKSDIAGTFGQRSHAGFESYARQYEGLLNIVNWRGDNGVIEFHRHPAEQMLIEAISVDQGLSRQAINHHAREFGYLPDEVDYLLRFLELRGYIEYDKGTQRYRSAHTLSQAELLSLAHDVLAEASLLGVFLASKIVDDILSAANDLQDTLKSRDDIDYADAQVRLLQLQRQVRLLRPDLIRRVFENLHKQRSLLYSIHNQLGKIPPESSTDLQLDKHVNGAQRSLIKSIKPVRKRLEALQTEVNNTTQQKRDVESFTLDQLTSLVNDLDNLRQRIKSAIDDAQKYLDTIDLQNNWLYLVDRIRRLFDSIAIARQLTDVTLLERRLQILTDDIQQELATRGTQEYREIYDEYNGAVETLAIELDQLVSLARQSQSSGTLVTEADAKLDPGVQKHDMADGYQSKVDSMYDATTQLGEMYRTSEKSPEDLLHYLIELERQGRLEVHLKELPTDE